jgi:hypothetical protein
MNPEGLVPSIAKTTFTLHKHLHANHGFGIKLTQPVLNVASLEAQVSIPFYFILMVFEA